MKNFTQHVAAFNHANAKTDRTGIAYELIEHDGKYFVGTEDEIGMFLLEVEQADQVQVCNYEAALLRMQA